MSIKSISTNSAWLVLEKAVKSGMALLVGAWVVRFLGPDQYGKIAYVVAIIAFFQAVASLGIDGVLIREIIAAQNLNKRDGRNYNLDNVDYSDLDKNRYIIDNPSILIQLVFYTRALSGFVLLVLCAILIGFLTGWNAQSIQLTVFIGGSLIFQAADTFDLWNQSQMKSKRTAIAKIIAYFLSNGLRIIFIEYDMSITWFGFVFFIESCIVAGGLLFTYLANNKWFVKINNSKLILRVLLKESWPVIVASVCAVAYSRLDQIFLEHYLGDESLGLYASSIMFASATYFLPGIICASIMPIAVRIKQESREKYIQTLRLTYGFLLIASLLITAITTLFSQEIVNVFFGASYREGGSILAVYSLTNVPVYLGVAHGIWMVNERKLNVSLYRAFAGALTSLGLCLLIVPQYGMIGAAYSTVIALFVSDIAVPWILNPGVFKEMLIGNSSD